MHLYQVLAGRVAHGRKQRYPRPEYMAIGEILEWAANSKGTGFGFPRAEQRKAGITVEGRKAVALRQWESLNADRLKYELIFARGDTIGHDQMESIRRFVERRASDGP